MLCPNCQSELRWVGDDSIDFEEGQEEILSVYDCPLCETEVHIYSKV